ncbi:MAG: FKBP-type peptidyl-prolyl cis-trans isomerase [Gammaproteobacteria bacterium]|nr:FKBP-type peptidyl-prolyl cis-trans isomerase [Gammaproteobacteria bacterium]
MSEQVVSRFKLVAFLYTILDEDGTTLEQSGLPMEYIHGSGNNQMFPEVEAALEGKKNGDEVSVTLSPEQGFGQHDPNLTFTDDLENVPAEYRVVGARPQFQNDMGEPMKLTVTNIEDGKLTLDANHPFAGKTITFKVTVNGLRDATPAEIGAGMPEADPAIVH